MKSRLSVVHFALVASALEGSCSSNPSTDSLDAGARDSQESSVPNGSSGGASGSSSGPATGVVPGGSSGNDSGGMFGGSSGGTAGMGAIGSSGGSGSSSNGGADSGIYMYLDSSTGADARSSGDGGGGVRTDSGDSGGATHRGVWRIMPLGDSITGSMCPPQLLSQQLKANGRGNFVFVGSNLNNQNCNGAPSVQTEGHGGYLVTDLVGTGKYAAQLPQWCSADKADIVLMLFGTNDAWNSRSTQSILDAYSVVLADLRAMNPSVIMFVGQITPLNPSGCSNCEANVENLNVQIPGWASSQSSAISPVYVVDVHSAFTASTYVPNSTYTSDGVHPNVAGSQLVADKWYQSLIGVGLP